LREITPSKQMAESYDHSRTGAPRNPEFAAFQIADRTPQAKRLAKLRPA